jgi:hypothetical protein
MVSIATAHTAAADSSTIRGMIAQFASARLICAVYELLDPSTMMVRIISKSLACELRSKRDAANSSKYHELGSNKLKRSTKRKITARREWTAADLRNLKAHSKARTPVVKISKEMKRTIGALRQKALVLGIGLGHQR